MATDPVTQIEVDGARIAVRVREGTTPGVVWLGGYKSDMLGTKAETLDQWAQETGRAFLRHDYSGHGESGGDFRQGTISRWLAESLAVLRTFSEGPQIFVGSSMGAWIALRMAQELRRSREGERIGALILLAPAPDFTRELVEPKLTEAQRRDLLEKDYFEEPSEYSGQPYMYTRALIEDGARNLVMDRPIDTHCPVQIIQGVADPDVPFTHALRLASLMPSDDVTLSLVPGGDHRLSRPEDLELLTGAVEAMIERVI